MYVTVSVALLETVLEAIIKGYHLTFEFMLWLLGDYFKDSEHGEM